MKTMIAAAAARQNENVEAASDETTMMATNVTTATNEAVARTTNATTL